MLMPTEKAAVGAKRAAKWAPRIGRPKTALLLTKARKRIASFEKNPASHGKPTMAATPSVNVAKVSGIFFASPPILKISCSWWQP